VQRGDLLLRQILECTSDCVVTVDQEWRFTYVNRRAEQELGFGASLIGVHILDAYPQFEETSFWPAYQEAMLTGEARHVEAFMPGLNAWYEAHAARTSDGLAIFFSNIDKRKQQQKRLEEQEDRLRRTLDHIPQMVWSTRPDGFHDYYSNLWYDFTGAPPGSTDGEGWNDMFHPDDQERAWGLWRESLQSGKPYEIQYRLRHHSGEYRWVLGRAWCERNEKGEIVRWYGTCTDIHEEMTAKQALQESEQLHRGVLNASADCIKILSISGCLELMNEPGRNVMQIDDFETIRGRSWADLWPSAARARVRSAVEEAALGGVSRFTDFCPTAGGTPKWWDVVVTPMFDETGTVTRLLAISRDITEQRRNSEQLQWASDHDALTGLPNRRAFNARLQAAVLRAMKSGHATGLLLMDLDHFKHVNDTMGHASGDELLRAFAERLKGVLRHGDYVARLGGDEFAIILEQVTGDQDLLALGSALTVRLREPIKVGDHYVTASTSIGGALFPRDASSASDLMKCADTALYARKSDGRGGTKLFEAELREDAQRVAHELALGRAAIGSGRVVPFYQPKINLKSHEVVGYEALLRWMDPETGVQLPHTVAESFKNYELAAGLGEIMQRQVMLDVAEGRVPDGAGMRVSINAAPAEFLRDDYAERFLALVAQTSVDPQALEVEVTEQVFFERHSRFVARALNKLHDSGVSVSMDDFGTGYSSLSHLRDFPVDVLKIDMSFVQQICSDPEIRSIVAAVIELARSLKIEVVAEGLETKSQLDMLLSMGCAVGQGYFFGRPLPVESILRNSPTGLAA
jgi:diguanylate cyclase (GGDEF)-like protein/PAS domain S-box-containing protein